MRHDELVEVVCHAMQRCSPAYVPDLPHAEARGDILYVLTKELQVGDVSVVHLGAARYRQAAPQRDTEKRTQYRQDEWGACSFAPLSMETFGRLGTP
jgi:hypothetical protein